MARTPRTPPRAYQTLLLVVAERRALRLLNRRKISLPRLSESPRLARPVARPPPAAGRYVIETSGAKAPDSLFYSRRQRPVPRTPLLPLPPPPFSLTSWRVMIPPRVRQPTPLMKRWSPPMFNLPPSQSTRNPPKPPLRSLPSTKCLRMTFWTSPSRTSPLRTPSFRKDKKLTSLPPNRSRRSSRCIFLHHRQLRSPSLSSRQLRAVTLRFPLQSMEFVSRRLFFLSVLPVGSPILLLFLGSPFVHRLSFPRLPRQATFQVRLPPHQLRSLATRAEAG